MRIGNWRATFTFWAIQDAWGVNNVTRKGKFIPVWDLDSAPLGSVISNLYDTQVLFRLPRIYVLRSSRPNNYLAYCFKQCDWSKCVAVIAFTKGLDMQFLKYGVARTKFTLRVSKKHGQSPICVYTLDSGYKEDCTAKDMWEWTTYETLRD